MMLRVQTAGSKSKRLGVICVGLAALLFEAALAPARITAVENDLSGRPRTDAGGVARSEAARERESTEEEGKTERVGGGEREGEPPDAVYVSSSEGDDSNNGLTEATPFRTLAAAASRLRDGHGDWMLLKRGDVWEGTLGRWNKSGHSAVKPMGIGAYGPAGARPLIKTGVNPGILALEDPVNHLTIRGIHFLAHAYDGTTNTTGLQWRGPSEDILIEDCYVEGYKTNLSVQSYAGEISNFTVRRCIVVDAYATAAHSQGLYASSVHGLTIEECLFDHNGWKEGTPGAEPTVYNHNLYISKVCTGLVVRRNLICRASSHGLQARPGGIVEDNVFVRNPLALSLGYVLGGSGPLEKGVSGRITGNVLLEGSDLGDKVRGYAMQIGNIVRPGGLTIANNIVAHVRSTSGGHGIQIDGTNGFDDGETGVGVNDLVIENNLVYDWGVPLSFQADDATQLAGIVVRNNAWQIQQWTFPKVGVFLAYLATPADAAITFSGNTYYADTKADFWFRSPAGRLSFDRWVADVGETDAKALRVQYEDPGRTVATYHKGLGRTGTFDAFIEQVRKQSSQNWRQEYTAPAIIAYIQQGFTPRR